jgi:hypothetical protein
MVGKLISGVVVLGAVAGFGPGVFVGQASAQISSQVTQTEPTHMVVTNQQAMVRCGAGMAYYPVSELRTNAILVMDGETPSGWARVKYPSTASAFVRIEYADIASDGKSLRLNRDDTLIAYNTLAGAKGSWSKLVSEPLPRGSEFKINAEATNKQSGELAGYQVEAPDEARGYVRTKFLRPATTAEVEAWKAAGDTQPMSTDSAESESIADDMPAVDPGTDAIPQTDPGVGQAADDVAANTDESVEQADDSLIEPMIDDSADASVAAQDTTPDGATDEAAEEAETPNAADTTAQQETVDAATDAGTEPESSQPAPLKIGSIEELEQIFTAVQKQTAEEAEYGPLLAEVQRMYDETPDNAESAGLRTALRQRLSVLKIRQRVQEAARSNADSLNDAKAREGEIVEKIRELEIKRSYAVVGRLLPSAVYDGQRLPRMYRIQSVDGTEAPRTLGYLRPSDEIRLEGMLGETIGVIGTPNLDPRLNLRIITPIKVDLIHSIEKQGG